MFKKVDLSLRRIYSIVLMYQMEPAAARKSFPDRVNFEMSKSLSL